MAKGHFWLAQPMKEIGTEMSEQTVEKLVTAAWKETEKEHMNDVAERIYGRNEKLNEAYQQRQILAPVHEIADGSITMNFQEIHQTLVDAWRPIFARWDGKEEPCYSESDLDESFREKRVTGVELRNTVQRWSDNAAAGADSWKRCEWKQFTEIRCMVRWQNT